MNKENVVAKYDYKDKNGKTLYFKERIEPGRDGRKKEFVFKHLKDDKCVLGRSCDPVPYNIPTLLKSQYVFIVEGEQKVEVLRKLGLTGTCLDSGSSSPWREEYNEYFAHLSKVVLLPDNDEAGEFYVLKLANALKQLTPKIKLVRLPGLPPKGDIVDWVKQRDEKDMQENKKELLEIVKNTPSWEPPKEPDLLSQLETWEYIQNQEEKVEWVVNKIIPKQSITVIFGRGGIGKTWLSLEIGKCIGSGIPFLEHETIKLPVIYVDFENPLSVLIERTKLLGDCKDVFFWRANNENTKPPKLDQPTEWEKYKKLPKNSVIVFDTLRAAHSKDENSSEFMSTIMGRLKELRDMGHTIILLHHTAKRNESTGKGSTAIRDLSDHVLGLTKVRKKGSDVEEIDEEDEDDEGIYRFGVKEKSRYEKYYIFLTQGINGGFEKAPDPREQQLEEMHRVLTQELAKDQKPHLKKTDFRDLVNKQANIPTNKFADLFNLGIGKHWEIEKAGKNNACLVTPIRFSGFLPYIYSKKPENRDPESKALSNENINQLFEGTQFAGLTEPAKKPENQVNKI